MREHNLDNLLLFHDHHVDLDGTAVNYIVSKLWPSGVGKEPEVYRKYFRQECDIWRRSDTAVAIETYKDLLDLLDHLKSNRYAPRSSSAILDFFPPLSMTKERLPSPIQEAPQQNLHLPLKERRASCEITAAKASIFLAVRLWLMLNVESGFTNTTVPGESLEWPEDQSLEDVINRCFPCVDLGFKTSQWPFSLNAFNLERIGGFQIVWTDHLGDHLSLNQDMDTISIYHHVQVLNGLRPHGHSDEILPDRLLLETLQTLALIIPRANRDCQRWFKRVFGETEKDSLDGGAGDVPLLPWARSPEQYDYWGPRLLMIKDAYDNSEPKHLGQWWHDRRRKVQWYTFWVAILVLVLTIVFGLIQSVTGVMQVYYSAHPV